MKESRGDLYLQFKPVGSYCNMRCKYCYAEPWFPPKMEIMPYDILEILIKKYLAFAKHPVISWHGGEPTLAGYEFFQKTVELIERSRSSNQLVMQAIQTTGTEISPELAKLFKEQKFAVSVSLDGPMDIHGINRVFPDGSNSFDKVMRGIRTLREHGINPTVMCTVTQQTLPYAEEVLEFFVSQGFKRIRYSPVVEIEKHKFDLTSDEWYDYLKTVFDKWYEIQDPELQIRELNEVMAWILKERLNSKPCNPCLPWVSIDPKGNAYPCEFLEGRYRYGNIKQIEFEKIPESIDYHEFKEIYEKASEKCRKCEFFELCGNGCPMARVDSNGRFSLSGLYAFCEVRLKLYSYIKRRFESALGGEEIWKTTQ